MLLIVKYTLSCLDFLQSISLFLKSDDLLLGVHVTVHVHDAR